MKFSRIVTLYNQWHHLTWLSDDFLFTPDAEFIFVDDHSSEPAPADVARRIEARGIKLVRQARNSGRCLARNAGAQIALGEYLDFIDGDDLPLPLRPDAAWMQAAADVVFFPFRVHGQGKSMQSSFVRHPLLIAPDAPEGFLDPRPAAVLWRQPFFLDAGGFAAQWELAEDLELVLRTLGRHRAFATQPKQSYNEQPRGRNGELAGAGQRLRLYNRLPLDHPARQSLLDGEIRALFLHSTWHMLEKGHERFLFRSALSLLWNLGKARLGFIDRTGGHSF